MQLRWISLVVAVLAVDVVVASGSVKESRSALSTALLAAQNLSGVAAVWTADGDAKYKRAFGYSDHRSQIPMTTDLRFPIASNTKLYTAVALYQLQERGKLNLSQSIGDYLDADDFVAFGLPNTTVFCPVAPATPPGHCEVVTFVQLLGMTAGIANNAWYWEFVPFIGSIGLLVGQYVSQALAFAPGTGYLYSNPSFVLAAYFVQKLSGLSFNQYVKLHITEPLGLRHTFYDQADQQFFFDPLRVSEYHRYLDPSTLELTSVGRCAELNLGSINGAGGMVSTLEDSMLWYFKLFNFTGTLGAGILSPASVMAIVRPQYPIAPNVYYGQGIAVQWVANETVPQLILYEGGLECVHTANILDLTQEPPQLTQVWSNSPIRFATLEQLVKSNSSTRPTQRRARGGV